MTDIETVINKFVEKYGKVVTSGPLDIVKYLNNVNKKYYKKNLDYKKYLTKNPNEKNIMSVIYFSFGPFFYKGENQVSLKRGVVFGPVIAKIKNDTKVISIYLDNKKNIQVGNTYVFAFYNKTKKNFMWTFPKDIANICKNPYFKKYSFCNANMLKNVELEEADKLALWYRLCIYIEKHVLNIKYPLKNMETTNLILFDTEIDNEEYTLYCIVDYGIEDPKFTPIMHTQISLLEHLMSRGNKSKKSMKGNKMYKGKHIDKLKL